jgi:methionyl-tRNA synthetase
VLAFLREPLEDLCISRPKSRIKWGINLPFDADYVTYVWFDALLNYVSALGYPDGELYKTYWPVAQHIVAKDILKPHGIYWPIMLKAAGIPVYQHLNVHGYWNVDQSKMSKSIGNVVEPLEMKNVYGLDAFRFFLMRDMAFGLDSNFNETALVQRINADLANDLGNLFSRVLSMAHKYFGGVVPEPGPGCGKGDGLWGWKPIPARHRRLYGQHGQVCLSQGAGSVWEFITHMNKYVDVTAPWVLAKNKATRRQLETVIYNLLEGLRIISGLIYPVMPDTAATMQKHLGFSGDDDFYKLDRLTSWKGVKPGVKLRKSISLFPRIDLEKKQPQPIESSCNTDHGQPHQTGNQHRRFCQNRPARSHRGVCPGRSHAPRNSFNWKWTWAKREPSSQAFPAATPPMIWWANRSSLWPTSNRPNSWACCPKACS